MYALHVVNIPLSLRGGHLDVVRYLVEDHHCDVNVQDNGGSTPLHVSCR